MKNIKGYSGCISWELYYNNPMLKKSLVNGEKDIGEHKNERNQYPCRAENPPLPKNEGDDDRNLCGDDP